MKTPLTLFLAAGMACLLNAQTAKLKESWTATPESKIKLAGERVIIPQRSKTFHLVNNNLKKALWMAPHENTVRLQESQTIIELPSPDGSLKKYRLVESPVMASELCSAYPTIKTFNVMGIDEPGTYGKLDWTELGFHAMIRRPGGDFFIDPYCRNNYDDYVVYNVSDFKKDPAHMIPEAGVIDKKQPTENTGVQKNMAMICAGATLRTYRLAVACTGEYAVAATGQANPTMAQTLSAIVTSVNRVDGVYETEVAVKMVLVATETLVVFTSGSTDPFNGNNNAGVLINESQTQIDNRIGNANYDIGHTFSTGGGGLAGLGVVCQTGNKASGITGSSNPTGDPYDIDYVAHEMGHQFDGNHTFRATSGACSGNQNPGTMVEPGSGITIQAYAGICGSNNDSTNSIPYFHSISFDEIMNFITNGSGDNCPVKTSTGNNPPTVTGSANYVVPKSTPFILTGSATDPDGDPVTYSWEEIDNNSTGGNWNSGTKPFFRSYNPVNAPWRMFPRLTVVQSGTYTTTVGEYLPTNQQTLNFRVTARDNKMGGGGVCYAAATVTVSSTVGPLSVTYPNVTGITWASASSQTVTWAVNGTTGTPVNCANVNILISYNSGQTWTMVMPNVANSGTQTITVPTVTATIATCRIKVESVGNIFFDISDKNFTITTGGTGINTASNNTIAMQLVPNPANEQVNVNLFGLNPTEKNNLVIYDMLGNVVMKDELSGKENYELNYDISAFSKGVYLVEISGNNKKAVSRLVKQ